MIEHDRLGHDDRPGGGVLQPRVDVQHPLQAAPSADIPSASAQPGRIGSGVTARASSTLASTALVDGRSTAAVMVLVATSIMPVSSARSVMPLSSTPGRPPAWSRSASTRPGPRVRPPNGPSGRLASDRRVRADPKVCLPADSSSSSR